MAGVGEVAAEIRHELVQQAGRGIPELFVNLRRRHSVTVRVQVSTWRMICVLMDSRCGRPAMLVATQRSNEGGSGVVLMLVALVLVLVLVLVPRPSSQQNGQH